METLLPIHLWTQVQLLMIDLAVQYLCIVLVGIGLLQYDRVLWWGQSVIA